MAERMSAAHAKAPQVLRKPPLRAYASGMHTAVAMSREVLGRTIRDAMMMARNMIMERWERVRIAIASPITHTIDLTCSISGAYEMEAVKPDAFNDASNK